MEAIDPRFEIGLHQAEKYALVWKTFFAGGDQEENGNVAVFSLQEPSWYVVAATETKEPEKWLAYAQDRKAQDPRYSVSALRRYIQETRIIDGCFNGTKSAAEPAPILPLPTLGNRRCPWVKPFCARSGRPVPVEECKDCDFLMDGTCEPAGSPNSLRED